MEKLTLLKIRLSVLWIIMGVTLYRCTAYFESGVIEGILAGETFWTTLAAQETLLFVTIWWLIPMFMAFLTLILKDSINRWTNIILGIVLTLLNIYHLVIHFTDMVPTVHQILIVVSTIVFSVLIIWYAWKWE